MQNDLMYKIVENQETGIIILDKSRNIVYANEIIKDLLDNNINSLFGNYINCNFTILEQADCQTTSNCRSCLINRTLNIVGENKSPKTISGIEIKKNGINATVSVKISLIDEYFLLEFIAMTVENEHLNFLSMLVDKSNDIIFFKDRHLKYEYVNKKFAESINTVRSEILGKKDEELKDKGFLSKSVYLQSKEGDIKTLENGYYYGIENVYGRYFRVSKENIDGGVLCISRDITEEMEAIENSEKDILTGLFNRRKFENTLDSIYQLKTECYLCIVDLDDLRTLNNEHGHIMGDKYLKILGDILNTKRSMNCSFFRIGGDEFAGFINIDTDPKEVFQNIFSRLRELDITPKLTISVGISKFNLNNDFLTNYELADSLLYEVKRNGKNSFIVKE